MKIDRDLLMHVSEVARLKLSDAELDEFLPQLKEVIGAFDKLSEVDTESVEPSFQPIPLRNRLRQDTIEPSLSQEEALSNSENRKDGFFVGPKAV